MATINYLNAVQVAAHIGVPTQTIHYRRSQGKMPPPDAMIGDMPGWKLRTIDTWPDAPKPKSDKRTGRVV